MKIIRTIKDYDLIYERLNSKSIGFVPTMGALHSGHLSLVKRSVKENDLTVVSIFVNPLQFGPKEDLDKYPKDEKGDLKMCNEHKADLVFIPSVKEIYVKDPTIVHVPNITEIMCGASRSGHFDGVTTVVCKLFNIIKPQKAYFGLKDYQQFVVISKMVKDLNMQIKVIGCETIREKDGLAMSSRNIFLDDRERELAGNINRGLKYGIELVKKKKHSSDQILNIVKEKFLKGIKIDYLGLYSKELEQFKANEIPKGNIVIAGAFFIGKTRLIDNMRVRI